MTMSSSRLTQIMLLPDSKEAKKPPCTSIDINPIPIDFTLQMMTFLSKREIQQLGSSSREFYRLVLTVHRKMLLKKKIATNFNNKIANLFPAETNLPEIKALADEELNRKLQIIEDATLSTDIKIVIRNIQYKPNPEVKQTEETVSKLQAIARTLDSSEVRLIQKIRIIFEPFTTKKH